MPVFNDNVTGALEFTVSWERGDASHTEWFLGRKINPVNDIFPRHMREELEGRSEGESVTLHYEPRMCIPRYRESLVPTLNRDRLRPKDIHGNAIDYRYGRFYPQGHINGLLDIYPDTLTPFRMTRLDDETFTADRNHPLASIPLTMTATIQYLEKRDTGTYGSLTHWRETTCDWGPGMEARPDNGPVDFFHPDFFNRIQPAEAPCPPLLDRTASDRIKAVFDRHIQPGLRVLNLPSRAPLRGQYQAATCVCAVEYMDHPVRTLKMAASSLEDNAPVLLAFSNRWDPAQVIQGWTELHEFERMGLVLEYLRMAGLGKDMSTLSFRNDWRPEDDPRFMETRGVSDPVYVVIGHKEP